MSSGFGRRSEIEQRLTPWLFIVCKHRAIDVRRERSRLTPLDDSRGAASGDGEPASKVERLQSLSRVEQIVAQLPEQQQQALVLRFSAGMSYKEIAEVMELSVAHVGVVLHTAIKTIRGQLGEHAPVALRSVP